MNWRRYDDCFLMVMALLMTSAGPAHMQSNASDYQYDVLPVMPEAQHK